jgi:hypothetical protein
MAAVISETQQANHHDIADLTCRRLADVQQNMERSMAHLDVMKSLLGGGLIDTIPSSLFSARILEHRESHRQQKYIIITN